MIVFLNANVAVWAVVCGPVFFVDVALGTVVYRGVRIMFICFFLCSVHSISFFIVIFILILMSLCCFELVFKNLIDN